MRECSERARDEKTLMVLHLTENEGWSCRDAGSQFGMTKNAVIGIKIELEKQSIALMVVVIPKILIAE